MKRLALLFALLPALAGATDVTIKGAVYTLTDHPRVLLDGPAGTVTARVKDPDGAGAGVAPQATDANPSFVALKNQIRACAAAPTYCSSMSERSTTTVLGALDWYMDNSQTDSLAMAIHWLNTVETWPTGGYGFSCDITNQYCGVSSWSDWPSQTMGDLATAYSLVRSQMSAGERTAFAEKMFNDDTAGYEDGCTNQLQQEVGATATYTSGSTAVTGTNLDGLTAGRKVYFRTAVSWATIATVNSAASITLTGAPQSPLGGNAPGQTGGLIFEMKPYTATTCGLAWMLQHHAYSVRSAVMNKLVLSHTSSYTSGSTEITLASVVGLPAAPFYITVPGTSETMRVTSVDGNVLTVERGKLWTAATASETPPKQVDYSTYIPRLGSGEAGSNLVIQKAAGFLLMGLALADDSARAVTYVNGTADYWIDSIYAGNRDMWTGLQQGGSTNYGNGRQLTMNHQVAAALKNIPPGAEASLDKSAGNWLANFVDFYLYTALPNSPTTNTPWGQPDLNQVAAYASHIWAPIQNFLLGEGSNSAKYWNYFQRSVANYYTSANLTAGANERMIPYLLLYQEEGFTATDYRTVLPTQKAFNVVDGNATRSINAWVSRTGFSSSNDTLVFAAGYNLNLSTDHLGTGAPGAYKLYKIGWLLGENGASDIGATDSTNMPLFGGAANVKSGAQNQRVDLDKTDAGTGWSFARFNLVNAYTATAAATRALRYLVHFKKAASQDYLVAFDDMAASSAKTMGQNLHYKKTVSTSITTTLPDIVLTVANRRVSTKVVTPSGTGIFGTYTNGTNIHRMNICASSTGSSCAAVTSAEFLTVHRPSADVADVMPTIGALGTIDSDYVGVQIEDATAPSVAVFPKLGAYQTSTSFTTTHAGTAQYVVTGMETGVYDVVRGVTTIVDDETIGTDGTIAFESVAGAFTLTRAGEVPAITITTASPLPDCVQHSPCNWHIDYSGGTPPVTYSKTLGSLCTGQSFSAAGDGSGIPTVGQTCTFTIHVEDALAATDDKEFSLTIVTPGPTLSVVATPGSTSVTVQFGTPTLAEDQSCEIVVSSSAIDPGTGQPVGPVAQTTSTNGPATRSVSLSGLVASTDHTVTVVCGTVASGQSSFTTTAAASGPTVAWTYKLRPSTRLTDRGVTNALVSYNVVGEAANTLSAGCSEGCPFTLPLLSGSTYEIQHEWIETVPEDVVWTSDVGVTVDGNSLTKTTAQPTTAGAISTQEITYGDGYVEFAASETSTFRIVGLSNGNTDTSYQEIDFGLDLGESAAFYVYENGTNRGTPGASAFGTYEPGDVMRVAVVSGVVKYSKNGTVFYTSQTAPTYPLLVDTWMLTNGATINEVVIGIPGSTLATSRKGTVAVP